MDFFYYKFTNRSSHLFIFFKPAYFLSKPPTFTEPWSKSTAHYSCIPPRVRLTPWIIHSALSTCLGGKKLKEKINPSCFCSFSSSFLFHYKSHRFSFPSPVLGSGLMCTEMLCEANKAKAARIYPSERQPARQAPVCLSASLCVSHLIGNN